MKILYLTKNYAGNRCSGNYDEQQELARHADVTFLGVGYPAFTDGMDLHAYCRTRDFDLIYYSQCATENPGRFAHVKEVPLPKVGWLHDGHNYMAQQIQRINDWDTTLLIFRSWNNQVPLYAHGVTCPMKCLPQGINPHVFHDYGLPKTYDACLPGINTPFYPLRVIMQRRLKELVAARELTCKFLKQVGGNVNLDVEYPMYRAQGAAWRADYAQVMNAAKITLTDGGLFHDFVRRYLEALACKSLLLASPPYLHERYGYLPYQHFIPVHHKNWEQELRYYLKHYDQFHRSIVDPAYQWVMQHHTTPIRVQQLLRIFEQVLQWN